VEYIGQIAHDSGSNFVAGLRDAALPNFSCLAHMLQLVINDGCLVQKDVSDLLAVGRRIVTNVQMWPIQEQLKLPEHRLIQDVSNRRNSSFYMLQHLLEQRVALTAANVELNVPAELWNSQWTLAEKVVKLLQIFEEATREASGNYSSAALVIPIVNSVCRALEIVEGDRGIMAMKRKMLDSLRHCYHDNDMESNIFYSLATVLDSRFKLLVFSSAAAAALCKQMLIAEYEKLAGGEPHDSHEATQPPPKNHALKQVLHRHHYFGGIAMN